MATVTVLSGIAASVFEFEGDSPIHRTVFGNIPTGLKIVFYTVIPVLLVYGAWMFAMRVKNWERGQPDRRQLRADNAHRRIKDWRAGVLMQTLLRDPGAGLMHLMLYYGFFILLGVTTTLEIDHQSLRVLDDVVAEAEIFGALEGDPGVVLGRPDADRQDPRGCGLADRADQQGQHAAGRAQESATTDRVVYGFTIFLIFLKHSCPLGLRPCASTLRPVPSNRIRMRTSAGGKWGAARSGHSTMQTPSPSKYSSKPASRNSSGSVNR